MAHPPTDRPQSRPNSREVENEDLKVPRREGEPPRSAAEPRGSEGSARTPKARTDPASGEPRPER